MHMMHAWDNQHLGTHNFESSGSGFVAVSIPVLLHQYAPRDSLRHFCYS
ncbi:hypothetical protein DAI22_12g169150 [Oryza sativa Japonica Group]|nr:hypothetical protein DAI22_12g169150 [Oryza sativa Japonica Group]